HYIAGAGTGGSISGTARYLKEQNPDVNIVGVDPFGSVYYKYFHERVFDHDEIYPYLTEGVGEDILAKNMDFDIVDDYVQVTDRDTMLMTRRLAREEGLFIGQSCGMAVAGALDWLHAHRESLSADDVVVVMLPDSGFRYLSKTYSDEWMRRNGFVQDRPELTAANVLRRRAEMGAVVAVSPSDTLADAIARMTEYGISQLPVIDEGEPVGSLTERSVLQRLIEDPASRDAAVADTMGDPLPVVPANLHLDHLSAYLDGPAGAVLVHASETAAGGDGAPVDGYYILTRSDLIAALAEASRSK
ncbi:MAG: pyridoxal-phosphate dependent enzyme, partial [Bacteroidota bacterium]